MHKIALLIKSIISTVGNKSMLIVVVIAAISIGCSGPRTIPDDKLGSIITDILLTEGVRNSGMKIYSDVSLDSIDFYSPVLNRYGYSIVDFRYTIGELSERKSNPLKGIIAKVVATIEQQAIAAQHRYDIERRFDSLSLAAYADTVYRMDSTIIGSLKKIRIRIDSVKAGDYRVLMDHKSMLDYRLPQKSLRYYFVQKDKKKTAEQTIWMSRSDKMSDFAETILSAKNRDSLVIYFAEIPINHYRNKKETQLKDTSLIRNIVIVYTPSIKDARRRYYNEMFGKDFVVFSDTLNINAQQFEKDSLPGPIG